VATAVQISQLTNQAICFENALHFLPGVNCTGIAALDDHRAPQCSSLGWCKISKGWITISAAGGKSAASQMLPAKLHFLCQMRQLAKKCCL